MPTVSVIIPTFNRCDLVVNAVESVLNQTYKDYEIIVVDDGSVDETAKRLEPYMAKLRYVYQENRGVSAAQNKGIELARGKWISILASDDVWHPTKLESQLNAVAVLGPNFGACFTNCTFSGNASLRISSFEQAGFWRSSQLGILLDPIQWILARYPIIYVQSLLVLRSVAEELRGMDEKMIVAEDTDFLFRLAFKTKFCFVNKRLVTIDRTPCRRVGLIEIFSEGTDRLFGCLEHMHKKWLQMPEPMGAEVRRQIHDSLKLLYYGWLVARLYRCGCGGMVGIAAKLKGMGDGYGKIAATLFSRATRKIRSVLPQSSFSRMRGRIPATHAAMLLQSDQVMSNLCNGL